MLENVVDVPVGACGTVSSNKITSGDYTFVNFPQETFAIAMLPKEIELVAPARKAYLSGPMTGLPGDNVDAFNENAALLRAEGFTVINPAELDAQYETDNVEWHEYLERDLRAMLEDPELEGVVLLPGWRNSRGANLEAYVAKEVGKKLYEIVDSNTFGDDAETFNGFNLLPVKLVSVAYEAQSIVLGARRFTYGHPLDNFERIADLFNATLREKLNTKLDIGDVAMLMIQVKIAREMNAQKQDNLTDIVGYALAADAAYAEREARNTTTQ